jgi:tRNA (guanine-N7-)-methyltransferase
MPHAIVKTDKNLEDIVSIGLFVFKNRGILPLNEPFNCFLDFYKKNDLLIIKLNKTTRSIVTDELKNEIFTISKNIANFLKADIVFHNLEPSHTHLNLCDCFEKISPQKDVFKLRKNTNNLEIGFGRGEFLLNLAKQKLDEFFYGIEIYGKDFLTALNRCCLQKLNNIKMINYDAKYAIDLFENNSFDNIYVNFPEPWFKFYRIQHSVFNKITFKKITDKIKQNGLLHIVTDNYPFAVYSSIIANYFGLKPKNKYFIEIKNDFNTLYAKKWKRLNRVFYSLILQKTYTSAPNFYKKYDFPIKLKRLEYKDDTLIFKVLGMYENKNVDYKIIEIAIGNYLAQHVFFGFLEDSIFLLPQTNFVFTDDFCDTLEKVT